MENTEHTAEKDASRVVRLTDRDAYLAALRDLEDEAAHNLTGATSPDLCCCHAVGESCGHGFEDEHVHKCLPRALDLDGHCPDDGCPGQCWTRVIPPGVGA